MLRTLGARARRLRQNLGLAIHRRGLVSFAAAALLVLSAAVLMGSSSGRPASLAATNVSNASNASRTPGISGGTSANAKSTALARADLHVETDDKGKDLEMHILLEQIGNDCQAPLNGGYCLRYSASLDEKPLLAGYGVIPATAVKVTQAKVALNVDTSKIASFTNMIGTGVHIVVTWNAATSSAKVRLHGASLQGSLGSYTIPLHGGVASVLFQ
jgi:hypothetical protein